MAARSVSDVAIFLICNNRQYEKLREIGEECIHQRFCEKSCKQTKFQRFQLILSVENGMIKFPYKAFIKSCIELALSRILLEA